MNRAPDSVFHVFIGLQAEKLWQAHHQPRHLRRSSAHQRIQTATYDGAAKCPSRSLQLESTEMSNHMVIILRKPAIFRVRSRDKIQHAAAIIVTTV